MKKFSEIIQTVRESASGDADLPVDEACWHTHKQEGMKKKGDRMVPNCVPKNEQFASDKPEPGREPVNNRFTSQSSKPVHKPAPLATPKVNEDLRKWFDPKHPEGGWKRINSKGEAIGPCAREPGEAKPKCMSNAKRASLTKKERASAVAAKRRHDPNPERKGEPINVSNYGKGKIGESMEQIEEKNSPTNPALWARAKALAKSKFDVYPSAYANGWASKWYKSKGGGWKTVSEAKDEQEYDYEGDMAKSDLRSILHNAKEIHDMLEPTTNMPEWCQSKITLAEDYLSTVANYLRGEMNEEVEQIEEMPGANMDTRAVHKHLRKSGWSLTRTKGAHDVYTHPKSEKHIAVPRHKQLKAPLVRGIMKDAQVSEEVEQIEEKGPGLWANIRAKRARGERMRKPGEKGAPSEAQLKSARNEEVEQVDESRGHKILATKLAQIDARKQREAEAAKRAAEEQKKKEPVKEEKKGSWQKDTGWKKAKPDTVVDKSGAKHSAMSRAKHLAKMASRKKVMEQDHNNQVDNIETPAKKSLAYRGVVKNTIKPTKGKKVSSDDKFEPEPELNTQIMRNSF